MDFQIGNARQPLALTLPLKNGLRHVPIRQLEIQGTSIARHDGRGMSASGTTVTSRGDPLESALWRKPENFYSS